MKVSCIIPTRDRCQMLMQALASVEGQRHSDLEIIVVDDGSADGTAAVVCERFPRVRLVRLSGVGPGPARNAGVAASRGDVVMFLDSDDIWLEGHVDTLLQTMERGYDVAYGTTRTMDRMGGGEFLIPDNGEGQEGDCFAALLSWCFLVPSAVALRRFAFDRSGGFIAGDMGEDWAFFLRLAEHFHFGFAGPGPVTLRCLHAGSLSSTGNCAAMARAVRRVGRVLQDTARAEPAALTRFSELENWIIEKGTTWTTVQDWYTAMKKAKMI